jgi:lipopolysaccharide transport system ATP-binding protein
MDRIIVSQLGKAYKKYPSRWARLREWISPTGKCHHSLHWVLRDLNFTVHAGEAVGIVGMNGAGKSTLLKMLAGTTQPTTGSVSIIGRVSALLELGMGFQPDFTGRQNVIIAGQLLGLSFADIDLLMPEIVDFAGIGDYINQPIRVYSSGMQMRLAFSIATAHRPDVLIVDEALSVGDSAFQRKCFRRIEDYLKSGTTLLYVSHDIESVKKLCNRALFIRDGHLAQYASAKHVCDAYEKYLFRSVGVPIEAIPKTDASSPEPDASKLDPSLLAHCEQSYGTGIAIIEDCWLEDKKRRPINVVDAGSPFRWCYRVQFYQDVQEPIFAMMLKTREGISLYGVNSSTSSDSPVIKACAGSTYDISFELSNVLAPGVYYLNCSVSRESESGLEFLHRRLDSAIIRVVASPQTTVISGLVELAAQMSIRQVSVQQVEGI